MTYTIAYGPAYAGDIGSGSVLAVAAYWIESLVFGPLATGLAVSGIALVGLLMLQGRVDWRRGGTVCLGCFIVFGAPALVASLQAGVLNDRQVALPDQQPVTVNPETPRPPLNYDPYAGAALPPE